MLHYARLVGSGGYSGGSLDTQTVTVGADGTTVVGDRRRGFVTASLGGISDGTSNVYGGAAIRQLDAEEQGFGGGFDVFLQIAGVQANSGWTSINIGGNHVLTRASATFFTSGGNSFWQWVGAGNLFGANGNNVVVGFD